LREPIDQLLREYRAVLEQIYGPRLRGVYLYGSYARDEAVAESDVDILVVLDEITESYHDEIERTSHLNAALSLRHDVSVSRVFMREHEWRSGRTPFLANVHGDAVPA
jgi:uncharacterized protein